MKKLFTLIVVCLTTISTWAYDVEVDGIYYNLVEKAKTAEVTYKTTSYNSYSGSVTIPEAIVSNDVMYSVTSIGEDAFCDCTGLTSLTIPSSVTSIGHEAYYYCTGLTSVTIPSSVTSIGAGAFMYCTGLTSVTIPSSVTSIGAGAFSECNLESIVVSSENSNYDSRDNCNAIINTETNELIAGCKNTTIPSSVTSIGFAAFDGCNGLSSITIPSSVTSIGNYAFAYCNGLTSVTIPSSVTSIGYSAFSCDNLESIIVSSENKNYDSRDNCNAIINTETNELIAGCKNTTIPSSVEKIGDDAFMYRKGLISVKIPSSVTSIGRNAFYCCSDLTSVTIPSSVTSIGGCAFNCCSYLTSIKNFATTPQTITSDVFDNATISDIILYVPKESIDAYKAADVWKDFGTIEGISETTDISTLDYAVYTTTVKGRVSGTISIPVNMKNVNAIATWQADLVLPSGFTIAKDSYDDPMIVISGGRTTTEQHGIATHTLASGATRILYNSSTNKTISGTDGEVATITLNIADDVEDGDYPIIFKNIVMSEADETSHEVEQVVSKISVKKYTPGDVNNDGKINAPDLVAVVNYILESPTEGDIREAADLNSDDNIDAIDYVAEVNLILTDESSSSAKSMAKEKKTADMYTGSLNVEPFTIAAGNEKEIILSMTNANAEYTCCQFDVLLPDGITITDAESMIGSHSVAYRTLDNGMTRILVSSLANKAIRSEEMVRLILKADNNMTEGSYSLGIDNTLLVTPQDDVASPSAVDFPFTVGNATGIDAVNTEASDAVRYNLAGQRVKASAKGIIIVNGKKEYVK